MNLLPLEVKRKRQRSALFIKLAAAQAVILLLLVMIVLGFDVAIRIMEGREVELAAQVADERFAESEEEMRRLREREGQEAAQQEAARWLELPEFEVKRLEALEETLPTGVLLHSADIDEEGAQLTLLTRNLSLADIHRYAWEATELVYRVQMVSAVSTEDGFVRYILAISWHEG